MADFPAIALVELSSIAAGTFAADRMVKKAVVQLLRAGTVHPGRYLILIGGGEAEVGLAHAAGIEAGGPQVLDDVFLPDAHPQVVAAIDDARRVAEYDSLTVLETSTVAAILRATDAAVKGALVELLEMRLADDLGGKGVAVLTGERADVEAAVEIAGRALVGREGTICHAIISRIDEAVADKVAASTRFRPPISDARAPDVKTNAPGGSPAKNK